MNTKSVSLNEGIARSKYFISRNSFNLLNLSPQQELQVRLQVKKAISPETAKDLSLTDLNRLYLLLIYCHNKKLKKSEIKSKFNLAYITKNLNKIIDIAQNAQWLSMTYPDVKNHKEQRYFTTESGKKVLRIK